MTYEDFSPESGAYWVDVEAEKNGQLIYENRFYQEIKETVVPVITPEDVMASPEIASETSIVVTPDDHASVAELKSVAPQSSRKRRIRSIFFSLPVWWPLWWEW